MSDETSTETTNVTVSRSNGKHCKKCNRVDSYDDMVCYDACESWEHFQCAGVSGSIADTNRSWKCSDCLANWDGASKVSFNESSISKSSRVSQRLQLSLQLLDEQRTLKKKRAEEETRILKLEEEAKLKEIDEEQEYLKQKFELLMQMGDEKDSSSRKSGVSVKSRRDQMEKWIDQGAQVDGAGQSKPSSSGQKATLPVPAVSQTNPGVPVQPTTIISSIVGTSNDAALLNPGILCSDPTITVPGGNVTALAKSYESLVVPTIAGSTSSYLPACSMIPVTVVATVFGGLVTCTGTAPTVTSSLVSTVPTVRMIPRVTLTGIHNPPINLGTAPVYSYPGMNTMLSSASGLIPSISYGVSDNYGNPQQYVPQTTTSSGPYFPISIPSNPAPAVPGNPPVPPTTASFQFPTVANGAPPGYPPLFPTSTTAYSHLAIPSNASVFPGYSVSFPYTAFPITRSEVVTSASGIQTSLGINESRSNPSNSWAAPTSAQLAARQVMPRELPKFSGDPEEWPIFYSSFKNTTEVCRYTDAENLARLQRCLGGSALEAVQSRLLLPAAVPYVMETLHKLYGRPEILISSLLKKVRNVPPPKADNLSTIISYGLVIQNLVDHIILADQQAHLSNPMLLQELVEKLPTSLKMQWGTFKQAFVHVNLATFNIFMSRLVDLASELSIGVDSAQNHHKQPKVENPKKEKLFTHTDESPTVPIKDSVVGEDRSNACSFCEKDGHQIVNCSSFKSLDIGDRWKAIWQKKLCRSCLIPHRKWPCHSKKECGVDGCRVRHHILLHSSRNDAEDGTMSSEIVHHNHHQTKSFSLFRYLPVTLYGNGKQVDTFVFLDEGSSSTLLEEGIAAQLGIEGEPDNLLLNWTGKISRHESTSKRLSVKISSADKKEMFKLGNVRTVCDLGLPSQTLDYTDLSNTFPHLQGLPVASYVDAKPGMIIGLEHVQLLTSLKIREGSISGPVATQTRLGWCVYGRSSCNEGSIEQLYVHACDEMSNNELHSNLHDSIRKFAVEDAVKEQLEFEADKQARTILEAITVRSSTRMAGLLWQNNNENFLDSYQTAVSGLKEEMTNKCRMVWAIAAKPSQQHLKLQAIGSLGQSVAVDKVGVANEELSDEGNQTAEVLVNLERFSNWDRLVRSMAYVHQEVRISKRTFCGGSQRQVLDHDDFAETGETSWHQAQEQAFSKEVHEQENSRSIGNHRSLLSVVPFREDLDVIWVGGCIVGQVRRATVQTAKGVLVRPALKLLAQDLEINDRSSEVVASDGSGSRVGGCRR